MDLKQRIDVDLKTAMKAKDKARVSALRLVMSAIKYKEIEYKVKSLPEEDILKTLSTLVKQRQESIEMFKQGGRTELMEKEQAELIILKQYLPSELSKEEVEKVVEEVIKFLNATSVKDMGPVMREVMKKVAGRADGKVVNELVCKKLS